MLGIFPGSRAQEIRRLWVPFRDAALQLLREGRCDRVVVAGTADGMYPDPGPAQIVREDPASLFAAADAALAKSGTTTLEAALADTPMVVAYKVHPLTYRLFQRLRTVHWVSLVNLVAEREVVPELLQDRGRDAGAGGGAPAAARSARSRRPSRSGRGWPWSARAWATPARPTGWWPWPTSC